MTTAILDVWNWRWTDLENRQCKQAQAEVFAVHLRLPESALLPLLAVSGWHGIFVEPRPPPGATSSFAVIWLPKHTTIDDAWRHQRSLDSVFWTCKDG